MSLLVCVLPSESYSISGPNSLSGISCADGWELEVEEGSGAVRGSRLHPLPDLISLPLMERDNFLDLSTALQVL